LDYKVKEALTIIKKAKRKSGNIPLVLNFSGGRDSLLLLNLIKKVTDDFICFFCVTGIDFPELNDQVKNSAKDFDLDIYYSYPSDHKGGFFDRMEKFGNFPLIQTTWCSRDLKWRPQKKVLTKLFGKNTFYKLNAVRRYESSRRRKLYKPTGFFREDYEVYNDIMVFPILSWTTKERDHYLAKNNIPIRTNLLYKKYKVSGCYWCPFYQANIYRRIICDFPNLYDKFIEWEIKLNKPSIVSKKWLRNIKDEMVYIKTLDQFV